MAYLYLIIFREKGSKPICMVIVTVGEHAYLGLPQIHLQQISILGKLSRSAGIQQNLFSIIFDPQR